MKKLLVIAVALLLPTAFAYAQAITPPAPTDLVATQAPGTVPAARLTWTAPTGPYGFVVYRSIDDTSHFQKIALASTPVYYDRSVRTGKTYLYYVTTVAMVSNSNAFLESAPSNIASVSFATPEQPTGIIAGTVSDDSTGKAISGIRIHFYRMRASITATDIPSAVTDSLGQYSAKLDTGTYTIKAQPAPWMPPGPPAYQAEWFDNKPDMASADRVTVSANASTVADFGLSRPGTTPVLKGTIAGTVIDDSTALPIRGILIRFYKKGPSLTNWQPTAITDSLGSYSATLDTGTYYVRAEGSIVSSVRTSYRPEWFDNVTQIALATPVGVTPGSAFTANFGLSKPVSPTYAYIEGTVTDTLGNALRCATVAIRRSFQDLQAFAASTVAGVGTEDVNIDGIGYIRGVVWTGRTDSLGKYKARVMAGHDYVAMAAKWGYQAEYYNNQSDPLLADIITVVTNVSGIDFSLSPNPILHNSISGIVRDSAGIGVPSVVILFPASPTPVRQRMRFGHTDSTGAYTIGEIALGTYIVLAVPYAGYAPAFYKAGAYGVMHWQLADKVLISGDIGAIDIGVVPIYSTGFVRLRGQIHADGLPLPGVRVLVRTQDGGVVGCGFTETTGTYVIEGVPVGSLVVEADCEEYTSLPTSVAVTGDQLEISGVDFALQTQGTTDVTANALVPTAFALEQNYPNPFNPTTVISCQLPVASDVRLVVYDVLGREVKVLMDEKKEPGNYEVTWDAHSLASGVYFYRLTVDGGGKELFSSARKMVLVR